MWEELLDYFCVHEAFFPWHTCPYSWAHALCNIVYNVKYLSRRTEFRKSMFEHALSPDLRVTEL